MINIKNLNKSFGKNEVLKGFNLSLVTPGIISILGPNGSGKTTLIKSILGMVIPNSGDIYVNDINIKNNWNYRSLIGYMPQIANFPENLTVKELFNMIKDLQGGLGDEKPFVDLFKLSAHLNKKLGNLSGGTKQKVNFTLTFINDKPIYILDEPITGLDPIALIQVKKILKQEKEKGKTILITTHIMSLVEELSDMIIFLLDGKIYFKGTIKELKEKYTENNMEQALAKIFLNNTTNN
ncbi:MAG: ABC transporter ATP-binding protein [Chlorobi bacterium]|nr:ABC transporter ATP-binding protein [Chlorobiota bacterium]